ncbi:hypothetical protein I4U23_024503 [Adineta vaga]|nr:hypothetical protein I4U23_024503 [Adineta vaga]
MRTNCILLLFTLFFTVLQYTNCYPRGIFFYEDDELDDIDENRMENFRPFVVDDPNKDKQKMLDALELISKSSEESDSDSDEQESHEKETVLSNYIDIQQQKILDDSDEN